MQTVSRTRPSQAGRRLQQQASQQAPIRQVSAPKADVQRIRPGSSSRPRSEEEVDRTGGKPPPSFRRTAGADTGKGRTTSADISAAPKRKTSRQAGGVATVSAPVTPASKQRKPGATASLPVDGNSTPAPQSKPPHPQCRSSPQSKHTPQSRPPPRRQSSVPGPKHLRQEAVSSPDSVVIAGAHAFNPFEDEDVDDGKDARGGGELVGGEGNDDASLFSKDSASLFGDFSIDSGTWRDQVGASVPSSTGQGKAQQKPRSQLQPQAHQQPPPQTQPQQPRPKSKNRVAAFKSNTAGQAVGNADSAGARPNPPVMKNLLATSSGVVNAKGAKKGPRKPSPPARHMSTGSTLTVKASNNSGNNKKKHTALKKTNSVDSSVANSAGGSTWSGIDPSAWNGRDIGGEGFPSFSCVPDNNKGVVPVGTKKTRNSGNMSVGTSLSRNRTASSGSFDGTNADRPSEATLLEAKTKKRGKSVGSTVSRTPLSSINNIVTEDNSSINGQSKNVTLSEAQDGLHPSLSEAILIQEAAFDPFRDDRSIASSLAAGSTLNGNSPTNLDSASAVAFASFDPFLDDDNAGASNNIDDADGEDSECVGEETAFDSRERSGRHVRRSHSGKPQTIHRFPPVTRSMLDEDDEDENELEDDKNGKNNHEKSGVTDGGSVDINKKNDVVMSMNATIARTYASDVEQEGMAGNNNNGDESNYEEGVTGFIQEIQSRDEPSNIQQQHMHQQNRHHDTSFNSFNNRFTPIVRNGRGGGDGNNIIDNNGNSKPPGILKNGRHSAVFNKHQQEASLQSHESWHQPHLPQENSQHHQQLPQGFITPMKDVIAYPSELKHDSALETTRDVSTAFSLTGATKIMPPLAPLLVEGGGVGVGGGGSIGSANHAHNTAVEGSSSVGGEGAGDDNTVTGESVLSNLTMSPIGRRGYRSKNSMRGEGGAGETEGGQNSPIAGTDTAPVDKILPVAVGSGVQVEVNLQEEMSYATVVTSLSDSSRDDGTSSEDDGEKGLASAKEGESYVMDCSVRGVIKIKVSPSGLVSTDPATSSVPPFYLQIYDPHQSFALRDEVHYAADVTSLFSTDDLDADAKRRTFQVEIPNGLSGEDVDVIKYEIGSASHRCVSPLTVHTKVQVAGRTFCRVAISIIPNSNHFHVPLGRGTGGLKPTISQLSVLMAIPPSIDASTMKMSRKGGHWDDLKRLLSWHIDKVKPGKTIIIQAQFGFAVSVDENVDDMEGTRNFNKERGLERDLESPKFPTLVRCHVTGHCVSDLELNVCEEEGYPINMTQNVSKSIRLLHRVS